MELKQAQKGNNASFLGFIHYTPFSNNYSILNILSFLNLNKSFNSFVLLFSDMDVDDGSKGEMVVSERQFDCVICGQTSHSTVDRPFGVAVLMQPSTGNVLLPSLLLFH